MRNNLILTFLFLVFWSTASIGKSITSFNCAVNSGTVSGLIEGDNNTLFIRNGAYIYASNPFSGCLNLQFPGQNYSADAGCYYNGALYIGGYRSLGFNDTTQIFKYYNGSWSIIGTVPNAAQIKFMTVFNNEMYIAGTFTSVNGLPTGNIAKFNGTSWSSGGIGLGNLQEVKALVVYNNVLYAAGRDLSNDAKLYMLTGNNWALHSTVSTGSFSTIETMCVYNSSLVIAGTFNNINGVSANNIARFNGSAWLPLSDGLSGGAGRVSALNVFYGKLFAGGGFNNSGIMSLNNLAEWNGSYWSDVSGGLPGGTVLCLQPFLGSLICGGFFTIPANGQSVELAKVSYCTTQITASGSTSFCAGTSKTLTATSGTAYQWYKSGNPISGATSGTYNATTAGTYICFITNNCGLSVSNSLVLTTNAQPNAIIYASGSTTFCAGGSVQLAVSPGANNSYHWKKYGNNISGANGLSYTATTAGKYKCMVVSPAGCSKMSNVIEVIINPLPTATITAAGPTTFCAGGSVVLNANSGAGLTYQWKKYANNIGGATNPSYTAAVAGKYKCTVTNANGCSKASNAITVSVPCRVGEFEEYESIKYTVYPNPSYGNITIKFDNETEGNYELIKILDLSGKEANCNIKPDKNQILVHNLKSGLYILKIRVGNTISNEKIVVF